MKKLITVPVFLLSFAGLTGFGQSVAAEVDDNVRMEIAKLCKAQAEGAIDPEIITQDCIEQKMEELSGESGAKEES